MSEPLTADDLLPLVARLSPAERIRLLRLIRSPEGDAVAYLAEPVKDDEFSSEQDHLGWEGDGWEDFE